MKPLFIILFVIAGCGTFEPVLVKREELRFKRMGCEYRHPDNQYYVIWVDDRGFEYKEIIRVDDTSVFVAKKTTSPFLIKRQ